ncbi:hypothetical protein AAFF_G00099610 [Aldrovandia affinis]|uniref:Uncharacterized protein n=1 Tax=Aldrovandia affinis TaxID=143900 RepID=A0AAD7RUX0_9TELE|nr:hypothetical protein AAFF_G00099610 [Aldrovandia affinis]
MLRAATEVASIEILRGIQMAPHPPRHARALLLSLPLPRVHCSKRSSALRLIEGQECPGSGGDPCRAVAPVCRALVFERRPGHRLGTGARR